MEPVNMWQHEALDRCAMISNILGDHLISHPLIQFTKIIKSKLLKVQNLIDDAYQLIGNSKVTTEQVDKTFERLFQRDPGYKMRRSSLAFR